jgi:hypothetical protein
MIARFAVVGGATVAAVALLVVGASAGVSASPRPGQLAPIQGPYAPKIDPANFVRTINNRYQPFKPGTVPFHGREGGYAADGRRGRPASHEADHRG